MDNLLMNNSEFTDFELKIPVNRKMRWISIFGIVLFLWIAFLVKLNNEGSGYFLFFIGFSLLELLGLFLSFSIIQVSRKSITATILYTKYRINWDEVKVIETDMASILDTMDMFDKTDWNTGNTVIFLGDKKCFPVQFRALNKEKAKFLRFLKELINERQIQVKPLSSVFMRHKNTKVKDSES